MMICMTKEECTYLSFVHRLLREVPGLSHYLHATGTDDETALRNSLAAGFQGAHPLLCYIHSQRNVKEKACQLGLSQVHKPGLQTCLFQARSNLVRFS